MCPLRTMFLFTLLCVAPAWADEPPPASEAAPQPPEEIVITEGREQPGAQPPAEPITPPSDVRMIRRPDAVIEEFRQAGRLVMVRIAPRFGPPYYLVDTDGDGSLETRRYPLDTGPVPQWMLLNW